ncbi:30S ribosomal protein S20 [Pectinatus sottacetonis]|uniref:30S ribosomal protein S20 n=1 Tax=Pectinatus sottacetonis TaxID=1002795 RepID=UPI0018C79F3F|nr:30S ribosomal protein S20 [Pectinatus sottacetonis]
MPNIKSSIRSVKTDAERRAKNAAVKSTVKTAFRKVSDAVKAGNADEAKTFLAVACKKIDKAAADHVYHKNTAARRKSRLAKKISAIVK